MQPSGTPLWGDTQSPSFYGVIGNIRNAGVDPSKPLTVLCWEVSAARAYAQGGAPVVPWVAGKSYVSSSLANSPWYDELLFHLALSVGCTNFNLWNADTAHTQDDAAAADADLSAMSVAAGGSTLTPITTAAVPYASSVLVSGASLANGHRLFRVTVATTQPADQTIMPTLPGETAATSLTIPAGVAGVFVTH